MGWVAEIGFVWAKGAGWFTVGLKESYMVYGRAERELYIYIPHTVYTS